MPKVEFSSSVELAADLTERLRLMSVEDTQDPVAYMDRVQAQIREFVLIVDANLELAMTTPETLQIVRAMFQVARSLGLDEERILPSEVRQYNALTRRKIEA